MFRAAEAKPPNGSDLMEDAEDFLVAGVVMPGGSAALLGGVAARLIPLCLVPRKGGASVVPSSARFAIASIGDLDFPLDSDEPVAPCTCKAVKLDEHDFITTSSKISYLVHPTAYQPHHEINNDQTL